MKSSGLTDSTTTAGLTGGCLCGAVKFSLAGDVRHVVNCFCTQCQKTTGNFVAATRAARTDLHITKQDSLKWYNSSPGVKRGFCENCGGNLFWDNTKEGQISVMAGMLDQPTGLKTTLNIYTADASDFHIIPEIPSVE